MIRTLTGLGLAILAALTAARQPALAQQCPDLPCRRFIEEALDKDPAFTAALQRYLQARSQWLSAQAVAAWNLAAAAGYDHVESISGSQFEPETLDRRRYELSLERLFLATGSRFQVSHTNSLSRFDYALTPAPGPGFGLENFVDLSPRVSTPAMTLSLSQPLLRNAFGLAARFPVRSAQLQAEAAWLDAAEAWENRVAELYNAYLDWAGAYENLSALRQIADDLATVLTWVRRRTAAGVATRLDLLETQTNLLQAQARAAEAEAVYAAESSRMAALRWGPEPVGPPEPGQLPCLEASLEECLAAPAPDTRVDLEKLRALRRLALLEEQTQAGIRIAENARLPELDLVGNYTRKGRAEDEGGGLDTFDRQDYAFGLNLRYPLGAPQAAGELGEAVAAAEEIRQNRVVLERDTRLTIQRLAEALTSQQKVFALRRQQAETAEARLAESRRRYNLGQLDTVFLIQAENDLVNARLQRIQALIQLKSQWVAWLAAADRLLSLHPVLEQRLDSEREAAP